MKTLAAVSADNQDFNDVYEQLEEPSVVELTDLEVNDVNAVTHVTHQSLFAGVEAKYCMCGEKKLYRAFCGTCVKSGELPQAMSL